MDSRNTSVLGAAIFWAYILAALVFSSIVLYTIFTLPGQHKNAATPTHGNRNITVLALLALLSFATLSTNMLRVLLQSFSTWLDEKPHSHHSMFAQVARWPLESTLFKDFANAIVADQGRYFWAESSLLATMSVCLYMGVEGRRRRIPNLAAFFCLAQILEVSWVQNLFYMALLRAPKPKVAVTVKRKAVVRMSGIYCFYLTVAPWASGSAWLIPLVMLARIMLCLPLVVGLQEVKGARPKGEEQEKAVSKDLGEDVAGRDIQRLAAVPMLAAFVIRVFALWRGDETFFGVLQALFSHPAVSSLGCDFIVSLVSFVAWTSMSDS